MSFTPESYLNPSTKPFPFCPGCSHGIVLEACAQALARQQIPPNRVAIVSDIGCIGMSDKHFDAHTFHGLHGRSVTYGVGLKLANPELTVIVLTGDGGLGIGGHHFLHAARRNVDITVLVCNNFNFGMTGGQHSVTTPNEAITATTTAGNLEHPLDVVGLVQVAKGNFAARALFSDKTLPDLIAEALATPGFAAVETWELCTAYFAKSNKVNRQALERQLETSGLKTGVLVRGERPGYVELLRRSAAAAGRTRSRGQAMDGEFPQPFSGRKTLLIAGRAGQKVRSTAILLGRAGVLSGLHVTQRDDYPVTVMTGHSTAEMIFEDAPINELGVESPDYVLITAPEGKKVVAEKLAKLPATAEVFALPDLLPVETSARVHVIPADRLGLAGLRTQTVLACAAYMLEAAGLLGFDALTRSASLEGRKEIGEENVATLQAVREKLR
jgi:pyruvate/2-oxoacid:ferredoxin oxidoreductase beta subunit/Pyruvate/2-oxoacid:ferredoxin oxidoreductase gamma subunit